MPTPVAIAIGSNLGDRRAHLDYSASRLGSILGHIRVSSYFETDPVDVPGQQPRFVNAAVTGEATLSARELLDALLEIEQERGRERRFVLEPLAEIAPNMLDPVTGKTARDC